MLNAQTLSRNPFVNQVNSVWATSKVHPQNCPCRNPFVNQVNSVTNALNKLNAIRSACRNPFVNQVNSVNTEAFR
ncbi:hypothetical cytosolic protein [Syntrophus aciditrophicus SB]|uniref:Hypothetical cytosolic protein n=1 Tax=Syntrophus aciditrophicus (strain SB) TaxID=56780 RepID=Q2LQX5_SYNAS|nr:hypothetical cytosolic protein [Syntrophus aciditrophicus SB]